MGPRVNIVRKGLLARSMGTSNDGGHYCTADVARRVGSQT
jgi:hypothetical protein